MAQDEGSWRTALDVTTSHGLSGGHMESHGVTPDGRVIDVTEHSHRVELNLTRFEFSLSRTFDDTWDAALRLPWMIKDQTATTVIDSGASAAERAAAERNGFIHHRTETYEGFADAELAVGWRRRDLFGDGSILRLSLGATLPIGETEPNPWVLGDAGHEHLHIQFGNGTFDPLVDFYLGLPLSETWAFSVYGKGRFPFYENGHGYRGSIEGTLIPRVTWLPNKRLSVSGGLAANYYGYSYWDGERDEESGQFTLNATVGAGYKLTDQLTASFSALFPVHTKSFSSGDSLDPAPAFSLSLAWQF